MKKILTILLILLLSLPCFAGRVQQAHKSVITAKNSGAAPVESKVAYDNFTGDDATDLDDHTSDSSHTWTHAGTSTLDINTNRVYTPSSTTYGYYYMSLVPADADYEVRGIIRFGTASGKPPFLGLRCSTSAATMYSAYFENGQWKIAKRVAGTLTVIATYTGDDTAGTQYSVRFRAVGTSLKLYVGANLRVDTTDGDITDKGRPVVGAAVGTNTATYYLDGFEVWE
jgi:hypothetical protein